MKKSDLSVLAAAIYIAPHLSIWLAVPLCIVLVVAGCLAATKE